MNYRVCSTCGCDRRMRCSRCRDGRCPHCGMTESSGTNASGGGWGRWASMRRGGTRGALSLVLAMTVALTGCATMRRGEARSTEQLLVAAGFQMRPADTAERQQRLAARPPYRLESHTKDGTVVYTYADPDGCKCLYVGGPKEYSQYQGLRAQQRIAQDEAWEAQEAEGDWGLWGRGW